MEPALDHSWINEVLKKYGIACSGHMSIQVSLYLKLLEKWNNKINLTGLRTPREMLVELFAESFFAGKFLEESDSPIVDVGSGAGFPGMVLKILNPYWRVYLLEPRKKRAAFLTFVKQELGILKTAVICKTLEDCSAIDFCETPRTFTFRGLGRVAEKLNQCPNLCGKQGKIVLFTTENEWKMKLEYVERIKWLKLVKIPWSHQKIIVTGIQT